MKVNGRLLKIALISFIGAAIIVAIIYTTMASSFAPEPKVKAYIYTKSLDKGMIITYSDIQEISIPKSLFSSALEQSLDNIIDKKIIVDVSAGEYVYSNKLTDRGRIETDYDNLYIVGLDVTNISDYLGTQLKVGDTYYLVIESIRNPEDAQGEIAVNYNRDMQIEIIIVGLIDNTGNEVLGDKQTPVKTINIGVKSLEEVNRIIANEQLDTIEIVRFPKE